MSKKKIRVDVEVENPKELPQKITWDADDSREETLDTPVLHMAVWDPNSKETLLLNLWTKHMTMYDMKCFHIQILQGLGQNILRSTGDEFMSVKMGELSEVLKSYLNRISEEKSGGDGV
ncbi:MAG: gliding motility protein GldC [Cytophagales bacterium]|nr:gliding motility protein GldC [Cytophagales bacterium]